MALSRPLRTRRLCPSTQGRGYHAVEVPVRSSLLHRKPTREPCVWLFPQRPLGAGSAGAWVRGRVEEPWGSTQMAIKLVPLPSAKNVTTIMNCIGSSRDRSSYLPPCRVL
jgi:hypothetical protein